MHFTMFEYAEALTCHLTDRARTPRCGSGIERAVVVQGCVVSARHQCSSNVFPCCTNRCEKRKKKKKKKRSGRMYDIVTRIFSCQGIYIQLAKYTKVFGRCRAGNVVYCVKWLHSLKGGSETNNAILTGHPFIEDRHG